MIPYTHYLQSKNKSSFISIWVSLFPPRHEVDLYANDSDNIYIPANIRQWMLISFYLNHLNLQKNYLIKNTLIQPIIELNHLNTNKYDYNSTQKFTYLNSHFIHLYAKFRINKQTLLARVTQEMNTIDFFNNLKWTIHTIYLMNSLS